MKMGEWTVELIVCCSLLLLTPLQPQSENSDVLDLEIGPISEIVLEDRGWSFELPFRVQNISHAPLYVPNPLDVFMSYPFRFFLMSPDQHILRDTKMERVPFLLETAWMKLEANEVKEFSKQVIIFKGDGFTTEHLTQKERLNDIIFAFILRETEAVFTKNSLFYGKIIYLKPFHDWEQRWLEQQNKSGDDLKKVQFWHGEVESNSLSLELSSVLKKID